MISFKAVFVPVLFCQMRLSRAVELSIFFRGWRHPSQNAPHKPQNLGGQGSLGGPSGRGVWEGGVLPKFFMFMPFLVPEEIHRNL